MLLSLPNGILNFQLPAASVASVVVHDVRHIVHDPSSNAAVPVTTITVGTSSQAGASSETVTLNITKVLHSSSTITSGFTSTVSQYLRFNTTFVQVVLSQSQLRTP